MSKDANNVKQVMILLGAGASPSPIPTTAQLTEWLCQDFRRYRLPCPHESANLMSVSEQGAHDWRQPYFGALHDLLKRYYGRHDYLLNFEMLLHTAWLIGEASSSSGTRSPLDSLLHPFFRFDEQFSSFGGMAMEALVEDAGNEILKLIAKQQDDKRIQMGTPLAHGIARLAEEAALRVFSLNYDTVALVRPKKTFSVHTGFSSDSAENQQFHPTLVHQRESSDHLFYQLHGSVHFGYENATDIVRFSSLCNALKNRDRSGIVTLPHQDRTSNIRLPAVMGFRKPDAILREPFFSYHHAFVEEAVTCKRWLIVGYGGADDDINAVLRHAWTVHESDADFRCVIVNWLDPHMWEYEPNEDGSCQGVMHDLEYGDTRIHNPQIPTIYPMYGAWKPLKVVAAGVPAPKRQALRFRKGIPLQSLDDERVKLSIVGTDLAFSCYLDEIMKFLDIM